MDLRGRKTLNRRQQIALLGGAVASFHWPFVAHAQRPSGRIFRIGVLGPSPGNLAAPVFDAFRQGLRDLGYVEGQNIVIESRFADWKLDRLADLAAELVQLKVDVIVCLSTPPGLAARRVTTTIPIVVGGMADPIADDLVTSLARPSANVTGLTFLGPELIPKRLGLLKQVIPGVARVAVLWHPGVYAEQTMTEMVNETKAAAATLGLELRFRGVRGPSEFEKAFAAIKDDRADAILLFPSPMLYLEHRRIVDLVATSHLPAMYAAREFVEAGGLMSYGANLWDIFRRAATYVDRIFKGAKPADLPVERPTKFEFVLNLKTANALGINVPLPIQQLADEVIE